ncbi:MAG TPA: TraB/GumN family protein [Gammaproteobacteria bacterium]
MPHKFLKYLLLVLSLLVAAPLQAGEQRGLLWEIRTPGRAVSYLFGTIHAEDERVLALPPQVQAALRDAPRFVMELVPNGAAAEQMSRRMVMPEGQKLAALLGPELHAQLLQVTSQYGLPAEAVGRLKPWALVMILSMPKPRSGLFLDQMLHEMAVRQDKAVAALESADEQIEALDGLSMAMQVELLRHTLQQYPEIAGLTEALIAAWLQRDLDLLQRLGEASNATLPAELERTVQARLVDERNARMVQRMLPLLKEGGVFVAVGALHLPGEQGIITLLRQRGFTVRALY